MKCADIQCCNPFRTNWLKIFPDRFLPVPVPVRPDLGGPIVPSANQSKPSDRFPDLSKRNSIKQLIPQNRYKNISYDMYCPSVKSKMKDRVCKDCGIYYPSVAAVKRHRVGNGCENHSDQEEQEQIITEDGEEEDEERAIDDEECPILNIFDILQDSAFIDDSDL